jgi:peroxiredoxin
MFKVNSPENTLLDSLDRTVQFQSMEADMISSTLNQLPRSNPRFYTLTDSLTKVREEKLRNINTFVADFRKNNTNSPAIRALWPLFMIPCRSEKPGLMKAFETEESYMLMHFWDHFYEANRHVTNHPMFYNKVNEYFFRFAEKSPQGLLDAGDKVVSMVDHNPIARAAVVRHMLNLFERNTGEEFYLTASDHFLSSCENEAAYEDERKVAERIRMLKVGLPAPDVQLSLAGNKKRKLSDYRGETVVLVFWASWCPHCMDELAELSRLSQELRPKGVRFVSVSLDEQEADWNAAIQSKALTEWDNSCEFKKWNSTAVRAYNIHHTPAVYIIAPDGTIAGKDIQPKNLAAHFTQAP